MQLLWKWWILPPVAMTSLNEASLRGSVAVDITWSDEAEYLSQRNLVGSRQQSRSTCWY